ncbi:hypothetical protein B1H58_11740 [Pantoea alhagi]|uniref:Type III effector n=1 Tax=Pantoea alhagi TaxID=1891675 RepID=A0A1W6B6E9_9GAMM|nr:hypothetical protein [Pantoea alhagi]ARJ42633.1 hypothetical protein B1H58_11740 [Pantoea alhagi]
MTNGIQRQPAVQNFSRPINNQTDAAGSSQTQGVRSHGASSVGHTGNVAAAGGVDAQRQKNITELKNLMKEFFTAGEGMEALIDSRATELHEMGYNPDSARSVLTKGKKLDAATDAALGALGAVAFATSSFPAEALAKVANNYFGFPPGTLTAEAVNGAIGGGTAMVMKSFWDKVSANAQHDAKWMDANMDKLEPAMQETVKHREGLGHNMKQALLGGTGYNARNVITGTVAASVAGLSEKQIYAANTATSTPLTVAAGALSGYVQNKANNLHGPEFLLGRTDWKERFKQLDDTQVMDQVVKGGAKRLADAAQGLVSPRQLTKGGMNILSGNMVAETMALGAGLAGVNSLRNMTRHAMEKETGNINVQQAVEQLVNLFGAAAAYAGQGVAGTIAGKPVDTNEQAIDSFFDKHPALDINNSRRKDNAAENTTTGNPLTASAAGQDGTAATGNDNAPADQTVDIPLRPLTQSGHQATASSSRADNASQQSLDSAFVARPKSASSQESFQSAISRASSPEELSALQAQQKIAAASGEWPLKNT